MADEQIQELRVRNDQICEELGLPKFQRDEQKQFPRNVQRGILHG